MFCWRKHSVWQENPILSIKSRRINNMTMSAWSSHRVSISQLCEVLMSLLINPCKWQTWVGKSYSLCSDVIRRSGWFEWLQLRRNLLPRCANLFTQVGRLQLIISKTFQHVLQPSSQKCHCMAFASINFVYKYFTPWEFLDMKYILLKSKYKEYPTEFEHSVLETELSLCLLNKVVSLNSYSSTFQGYR